MQQWVQTYNGTGNEFDSGNSLAVDNQGNVYVTGGSDNVNNTDFITIKYSSTIGLQQVTTEIPSKLSLEQNYPNPFNPVTKIRFNVPAAQNIVIKIYSAAGSEMTTLVNEYLNAGSYESSFNASSYPSGVYFYKLISGSFTETRKMILIK